MLMRSFRTELSKSFGPREPSTKRFSYRMGKILGDSAEQHLEVVPDADLRLLAQIELAAGLCGLPELGSMTHSLRPRRSSMP